MPCRPFFAMAVTVTAALIASPALAQPAGPVMASPGATSSAGTGAFVMPGGGAAGADVRAPITGTLPAPIPGNLPSPEPFPGGMPSSIVEPPTGNAGGAVATPAQPGAAPGVGYAPGVVAPGIATRTQGAGAAPGTPPLGGYSAVDVAAAFLAADIDGDGVLTRGEAGLLPLHPLGFTQMDRDGDGRITRNEYEDAMGVGLPTP